MFTQLLKPVMAKVHPVTIEEVKHSTQKEKRIINTLEPILNQHRLIVAHSPIPYPYGSYLAHGSVMDRRLIEQDYQSTQEMPSAQSLRYQLFYQMTRITKERGALAEYDRLDVLAMAVAYWVEQMARDVDMAIADEKERRLKDALENFMGHVLGHQPKHDTWMDV